MDEDLFRRMQEAALRFRSGESDFEEIVTPAGPAHLVRDRNDPRGFRLDFVGDGARHVVPVQEYPSAPSRPPGYPAPLPFLAGCPAIVNTVDQAVSWPDPPDVGQAVEHLVRDSLDDGWTRLEAASAAHTEGDLLCVLARMQSSAPWRSSRRAGARGWSCRSGGRTREARPASRVGVASVPSNGRRSRDDFAWSQDLTE